MTRTSPSVLVLLAVIGGVIGWFVEMALVASGQAAYVPPVTLAAVLALIGIGVVVLAVPVFRVVRGTAKARVDPFYATRVVVLAKASSLTGALFAGVAIAFLVFLLTRSVPATGSLAPTISTVVAAVVLLIGGLIAEKMCTLPPHDDDSTESPASQEQV